jgi:Domain of unknown function (DUF397)
MYTPIQPTPGLAADPLDGAVWRKSSYSGTQGNCVEVATNLPGIVAVRDSKNPDRATVIISRAGWAAFAAGVREGRFEA